MKKVNKAWYKCTYQDNSDDSWFELQKSRGYRSATFIPQLGQHSYGWSDGILSRLKTKSANSKYANFQRTIKLMDGLFDMRVMMRPYINTRLERKCKSSKT